MTSSQTTRYSTVAIVLHWLTAALILYMLIFGEDLIRRQDGAPISALDWGPTAHASWGIVVLLLTLVRLFWRMGHQPPSLPTTMKSWEVTLSRITHGIFYVLMLGTPILGLFAFSAYTTHHAGAETASFFKLFNVNFLPNIGEWTMGLHGLATKLIWAFLALHVLAGLKHQFVDRDNILSRMWFGKR
jgi:cytochrome b561